MKHQDQVLVQTERLKEGIEILDVVLEVIRIARRGRRPAMGDEVRRDNPAHPLDMRDDVAPQERRRRVPMHKHDWVTLADIDVGHFGIADRDRLAQIRIRGGQSLARVGGRVDGFRRHLCLS